MTVYELIQELTEYEPNVEITFKVGNLTTDNIETRLMKHYGGFSDELEIELS